MVLKSKDDVGPAVAELDRLLTLRLTEQQRRDIEGEKATLRAGAKAEQEAAYLIDFELKDSKHWVVLHDLRFEHKGRVAQIDHLILFRDLDVYVVETKGFKTKVRIIDGRWEHIRNSHWTGIPSPVAQNDRHIHVLKEMIRDLGLAPRFFGAVAQPMRFVNVVTIPPECVVRGERAEVMVVSMDQLVKTLKRDLPLLGRNILSWASEDQLVELASLLIERHKPIQFDYAARFGVKDQAQPQADSPPKSKTVARQQCESCGGLLSEAEVFFCRINKARFAGARLCRKCQALAPRGERQTQAPKASNRGRVSEAGQPSPVGTAVCSSCGVQVDQKVVAYCRINSKRFGGKVSCRSCQTKPVR